MMKKRWTILLTMVCLMLMLLPGTVLAANSGSYEDINWVFTDDGNLTVSGAGTVSDVNNWAKGFGREDIKAVIITDGITSIGYGAFQLCSNITSVTIPDTVISIDNYAFYGCGNLANITIPENVTRIGDYAFYECTSFTNINIPDSVTSLRDSAFNKCSNLTSAKISENVTSINYQVFAFCEKLTNVTIPDGVTIIEKNAFLGCDSLTSINIPKNVTTIGEGAFFGCDNLKSVTIPESVTNIDREAFCDCKSIVNINIPKNVTNIGRRAFDGCTALSNVYYAGLKGDWGNITIGEHNKELLNATIHFGDSLSGKLSNSSSSGITSSNSSQISIMLNDKPLSFSQSPYMANNTTMVPMRVIFEALGADVNYDSASQKITATKGDILIELVIGDKTANKNGESIALDAAAVTKNGNTMVPLRFVAEALQAQVDWDNASHIITITLE